MSNELILAVVLTVVLVADLIIRSLRKKDKIDDSPKIGEETSKKRRFNFNYFINRKRNIITFFVLGLVLKPAIHYQFNAETEKYVNTESKIPAPDKRVEFDFLCFKNESVYKRYGHLFSRSWQVKYFDYHDWMNKDTRELSDEQYVTHISRIVDLLDIVEKEYTDNDIVPLKIDEKDHTLYDDEGNQVILEKEGEIVNFFIHPKESRKINLQFHFDNIFKLKLWIFLISFSFMGLLVFLFNDKIQAR